MKGVPRERSLQARQQLGQELRRQLVAKRRAANAASASFFRLTPCPPLRHQSHQSGAVHWQRRASLYPSCPSVAANSVLFNRLFFLSAARRWRLPCLMTLLLLYPALSRHSVRRGETLNFCNGLKWSKYHSPPPSSSSSHHPPPPPPSCICYSFKPRYHLLPNFLVHWQRQRAFPWRGNPCGFPCFSQLGTLFISQQLSWVIPHILPQNSREGPFS